MLIKKKSVYPNLLKLYSNLYHTLEFKSSSNFDKLLEIYSNFMFLKNCEDIELFGYLNFTWTLLVRESLNKKSGSERFSNRV